MKNILIIGANGSLARAVIATAEHHPDFNLTLFARRAPRHTGKHRVIIGDALNPADLQNAMQGQDIVYVNLAGDLAAMGANIVAAMQTAGVRRVIAVSSIGIYETPLREILRPIAPLPTSSSNRDWITLSCAPTGSPMPMKSTTSSRLKGSLKRAARFQGKALLILCAGFLSSPNCGLRGI